MAMSVTTVSLPNGEIGVPYSVTLAETGGVAPITWTKSSGTIPSGLSLAGATGIVSGTPIATDSAGAVQFTATDSTPVTPQTANSSGLTFTIFAALAITTTALPVVKQNVAYSTTLAVSGGSGSVTWAITAGVLPPGLSLNASTGVISGTPTTAASGNITVQATDSLGGVSSQNFAFSVSGITPNYSNSMATLPVGWPLMQVPGSGRITNNATEETTNANATEVYNSQLQAGLENSGVL